MTAGELIDLLEELPQGTPVVVRTTNAGAMRATAKIEMMRKVSGTFVQFQAPKSANRNDTQVVVIE